MKLNLRNNQCHSGMGAVIVETLQIPNSEFGKETMLSWFLCRKVAFGGESKGVGGDSKVHDL